MKKCFYIGLFFASTVSMMAQTANDVTLESMRQEFISEINQQRDDFEQYSEQARLEYERYEQQMRQEYTSYVQSIKNVWGNDSIVEDSPTEWVEYGDDYKSRSIVDFDNNDITIEIALDNINPKDEYQINQKLEEAIERLLESRGSSCPYKSGVDKNQPLTERPILEGIVDLSQYAIDISTTPVEAQPKAKRQAPPTPTVRGKELTLPQKDQADQGVKLASSGGKMSDRVNAQKEIKHPAQNKAKPIVTPKPVVKQTPKAVAKAVVKQTPKKTVTVKGADNKERTVVQVQMKLVSDNLSKNAALYKDFVARYSEKFQIEQPLIYAVMEQESRFNPEATSWVPAYGLMQLVPKSGGFDAYRYVYKNEWIPSKSYLYVPHQNIELGTAYLRILMNQFSGVTDPECRRLCVIAGYNTGAGNVSRAFTGNTKLKNAIPLINQYNYQQLYDHLTKKLSTEEARNYVSGVSKRREKYIKQ